jgi:hypothetical protein
MTTIRGEAVILHELFISLTGAGFTEDQALKIIIGMLANSVDDNE